MQYTQLTPQQQIDFVTSRIASLESEHYGNACARMSTEANTTLDANAKAAQLQQWDTNLQILADAIDAMNKELASLQASPSTSTADSTLPAADQPII